ncbi:hypothetical protein LCGC14_2211850 [marine sediment metagenome]|uniref:Glyoxal oxidase N-terminal domain-containing protein n=1 Tax=marine sediment metagenome TaxID=412755 RepID=A0A0F9FR38_9ZZZZ
MDNSIRRTWLKGLVRVLVVAVALLASLWPAESRAEPSTTGAWSAPVTLPGVSIHAALLPTGKILTFQWPAGGPGSAAWVLDPSTIGLSSVPVGANIFCSGHSFLWDGRLLVFGGHGAGDAAGIRDVHTFDPFTEQWTRVGETAVGRWYPTSVSLGDGSVLVFGGSDEQGNVTPLVERYDPVSGIQVVPGADRFVGVYPRMHLLSSGKVFDTGPQSLTGTFDPATVTWEVVGSSNYGYRSGGTSVLLPLNPPDYRPKVLIFGGGDPATDTAEIIDMADFFRKVWALGEAGIEVPLTILQGSQINLVTVLSGDRYNDL